MRRMLRDALEALRLELAYLREHLPEFAGLMALIASVGAVQRFLIIGSGVSPIHTRAAEGDLQGAALLILFSNALTLAVFYAGFYFIFWRAVGIAVRRCERVELADCSLWRRLASSERARIAFSLAVAPVALVMVTLNSMRLFGCPVTPEGLAFVFTESVRKLYGLLEFLAYYLAITAPAFARVWQRIATLAVAVASLAFAALIEASLLVSLLQQQ